MVDEPASPVHSPSLADVARDWGRIGCLGFGGPPAHVAMLRELTVVRREWLTSVQFERAVAATNMLPGPASTQLAIYCAWRLRGARGALVGGICFLGPGLVLILGLAALFLSGSTPRWLRAAGMGAGAAVPAVAVLAGLALASPIWASAVPPRRTRMFAYGLLGALAAALTGPWLVLVLLGCGVAELSARRLADGAGPFNAWVALALGSTPGGVLALCWTSLKVGALAFGGGFVIVPLMQSDAVATHHWMSHSQFLNAVALGQVTPGPVTHTVAAVGYAAGGLPGGLLAAAVAFAPSFSFILLGAARFERMMGNGRVLAFLGGASPGAAGAILGATVPLTGALSEGWQYGVLAGAGVWLLALRRPVVPALLLAGLAGAAAGLLGGPVGS
ncbi:MAG TPA: chromate efflux transporter [Solirubrobacteraceae bacterium]